MAFRNAESEAGRITFTRASAARIANAVQVVESQRPAAQPLTFERVAESAKRVFRVATFTGAWPINATKTVTFKYQTSTPNTVMAVNLVCGLSPASSCDVSIAKEGTAWYLVQPNLTQLPGYSTSGTQVLTIVSGNLRFVGTTAC
jgi:hypothetical protein